MRKAGSDKIGGAIDPPHFAPTHPVLGPTPTSCSSYLIALANTKCWKTWKKWAKSRCNFYQMAPGSHRTALRRYGVERICPKRTAPCLGGFLGALGGSWS